MTITLSNNDIVTLSLENNGLLHYTLDGNKIPISLPRVNDGHWHNIEVKWMTAEIWFSLDFGQYEITIQYEAKLQNSFVSQVLVGNEEAGFSGCVQVGQKLRKFWGSQSHDLVWFDRTCELEIQSLTYVSHPQRKG